MKWLEQHPQVETGISFGRPWKQGELRPDDVETIALADAAVPHQARILAYWPDGSVKWTAHAAVASAGQDAAALEPATGVRRVSERGSLATDTAEGVKVDTGALRLTIPRSGARLTGAIEAADGTVIGTALRLAVLTTAARTGTSPAPAEIQVHSAEVETPGAVRTTVKVTGSVQSNGTELLRFIVRLVFFAGQATISITQTLLFRDTAKDRVLKGIGLQLDRPVSGDLLNRHVRIAGDDTIYTEPVQSLYSRPFSGENPAYERQLAGLSVEPDAATERVFDVGRQNAVWSAFRLTQESEDYFRLEKQTKARLAPVRMGKGRRAAGLLYAGDPCGGVAVSMRDFWQKCPSALEVENLAEDTATFTAWSWAESVEPMDLRHYSDECYVPSAYEGFDELRSTPEGVANSSHIAFDFVSGSPDAVWLKALARERQNPARAVAEPELYYASRAIGTTWGLPVSDSADLRSAAGDQPAVGALLERRLAGLVDFYAREVEQRGWYGYWNYGDFMHSYDQYRHQWRYDLGGFAWANNELAPNMWLWQYFLRSGDATAYRLAEAMTWHSAEVDRHHFGDYAQLGSRHNVLHWGCGCKEVRISMAGLHRYYYYLTGDERIGELLSEVREAEGALDRLDPMREFYERTPERTHIRVGPDWAALTSNWFTEWERTGKTEWRDRIVKGIAQLAAMPHRLLSGPTLEFDADKLDLHHMFTGTEGGFHMIIAFGGPQTWLEIAEVLDHDQFRDMLAEFGRFYALADEEKRNLTDGALSERHFSWPMMATGMMAFAARHYGDAELARKAWRILLDDAGDDLLLPFDETIQDASTWRPVKELPGLSTNGASQWSLNVLLCLELLGPPEALDNPDAAEPHVAATH